MANAKSVLIQLTSIAETMRHRPAVPIATRVAARDDVLPLASPIQGPDGKEYDQVVLPEGTWLECSLAAYNFNPEYWGEDAHIFNPDRFLREGGPLVNGKKAPQGSMDGLIGFIVGPRMCLGWRFAWVSRYARDASIETESTNDPSGWRKCRSCWQN